MKVIKIPKKEKKKLVLHKLNWLEYIAIGLSLWFLFYPMPYNILLVILLLMPFIGMFLNGLERPSIASLVEIDREAKNEYDVADFIDIPAAIILLRVLLDFETDSYLAILIAGTIALIAICLYLLITHQKIKDSNKDKWWIYSSIIFCFCMYSYSSVVAVNCVFDNSEPKIFKTEIIDKHISRSSKGRKIYYVKVKPWGHHYDAENISVPQTEYELLEINQKVNIDYYEGLLGIPWYYIE